MSFGCITGAFHGSESYTIHILNGRSNFSHSDRLGIAKLLGFWSVEQVD